MNNEIKNVLSCLKNSFRSPDFTKRGTLKIFKKYYNGDFKIFIEDGLLYIDNDMHFELEMKYEDNKEKRTIFGFIQLCLIVFDFSFTVEIYSFKDLIDFYKNLQI